MINVGQISNNHYSSDSVLQDSLAVFDKHYNWKHFRVGCEADVRKHSIILGAYQDYYKCFEEELKDKIRESLNTRECKPCHSLKKHVNLFRDNNKGCEDFNCITSKCNINVSDW